MRGGRGRLGHVTTMGVEQHPQPVVLEGAEAMAAPLDLLHEQVQPFGRAVGGTGVVMGQDLGAPSSQGVAGSTRPSVVDGL